MIGFIASCAFQAFVYAMKNLRLKNFTKCCFCCWYCWYCWCCCCPVLFLLFLQTFSFTSSLNSIWNSTCFKIAAFNKKCWIYRKYTHVKWTKSNFECDLLVGIVVRYVVYGIINFGLEIETTSTHNNQKDETYSSCYFVKSNRTNGMAKGAHLEPNLFDLVYKHDIYLPKHKI